MPQCTDSLQPVMVLGPDRKLGIARDTSFQPFRPTRENFRIAPPPGTDKVTLRLALTYRLRPGNELVLHCWEKEVAAPLAPPAAKVSAAPAAQAAPATPVAPASPPR